MTDKPTPGSAAAVAAGCRCPVMDNHHGKGVSDGDDLLFWINFDCPLHGTGPVDGLLFLKEKKS